MGLHGGGIRAERTEKIGPAAATKLRRNHALDRLQAADSMESTLFARHARELVCCVEFDLGKRRRICVTRGDGGNGPTRRSTSIKRAIVRSGTSLWLD